MKQNLQNLPLEEESLLLQELSSTVKDPRLLLRSKLTSITRSIAQLTEKKKRLTVEINRQKQSLQRKRNELKRSKSSTSVKVVLKEEDYRKHFPDSSGPINLDGLDQKLLSISSDILDSDD